MYKYLLWDIDGTVLDFAASEASTMRKLFGKYRLGDLSDDMLHKYSSINAAYWEALELGKFTRQEIQVMRFYDFFHVIGIEPAFAEVLAAEFNRDFILSLGEHPVFIDNAEKVLKSEIGKYKQIAITNGTKSVQAQKLRLCGLDKIFDAVFISEDVGAEKPSMEFFGHVFKAMGIKNRNEVLIIGDSLTADMKGGELSGTDTCWFNPGHLQNNTDIKVTYVVDTLLKIPEILRSAELR